MVDTKFEIWLAEDGFRLFTDLRFRNFVEDLQLDDFKELTDSETLNILNKAR